MINTKFWTKKNTSPKIKIKVWTPPIQSYVRKVPTQTKDFSPI